MIKIAIVDENEKEILVSPYINMSKKNLLEYSNVDIDIIKETFEAHIKDTPVYVFESVEEAMKKWDNRLMFATGSLYLVGDVDRALEGKENNHD